MGKAPKTTSEEIEELRAAIREGHELLKDLRTAHKDLRTLQAEVVGLIDGIPAKVDARIVAAVTKGLETLGDQTKQAMEKNVEKVAREFDRLQEIFTGTDPQSRREGKASLENMLIERRDLIRLRAQGMAP
ncbi:hypothetical protein [Herbidospora mongoliensis]|uniref:hypothetical protein n=1 Tax=Herbidospora mongoliensis TaxID=688067 RepID=UPI00082DAB54|nr:hypothetical protein [Herbidospora mongoliensis]